MWFSDTSSHSNERYLSTPKKKAKMSKAHIFKTMVAVGFNLGVVIVQYLRESRGKFRATPTSGVGVATDHANAVRNRPFSPSVPSAGVLWRRQIQASNVGFSIRPELLKSLEWSLQLLRIRKTVKFSILREVGPFLISGHICVTADGAS